jgi:hypothetical protein
MDAIQRIAHRYGNNRNELRKFDINFYAVNKKGEYGAAALWGVRTNLRGQERNSQFAVHDGKEAKLVDCAYLFEKK